MGKRKREYRVEIEMKGKWHFLIGAQGKKCCMEDFVFGFRYGQGKCGALRIRCVNDGTILREYPEKSGNIHLNSATRAVDETPLDDAVRGGVTFVDSPRSVRQQKKSPD